MQHRQRSAEEETALLREQALAKTSKLEQTQEELVRAKRRADMASSEMSAAFNSRLALVASDRDTAGGRCAYWLSML